MDVRTCSLVLAGVCGTEGATREQQHHAFLTVQQAIVEGNRRVSSYEGAGDDVAEDAELAQWTRCLLTSDAQVLLSLPDARKSLLMIAASISPSQLASLPEETTSSAAATTEGELVAEVVKCEDNGRSLILFFRQAIVVQFVNSIFEDASFVAGQAEWTSIANLFKMKRVVLPTCFHCIVALAAKELAFLLHVSDASWNSQLSISIRVRTQHVLCALNSMLALEVKLIAEHCFVHLLQVSARIESGYVAQSEEELLQQQQQQQQQLAYDSSSGDEGDEDGLLGDEIKDASNTLNAQSRKKMQRKQRQAVDLFPKILLDSTAPEEQRSAALKERMRLLKEYLDKEANLPSNRMQWCEMCLNLLVMIMAKCLREQAVKTALQRDVTEYYLMMSSPCWQRQLLSLLVLQLVLEVHVRRDISSEKSEGEVLGDGKLPKKGGDPNASKDTLKKPHPESLGNSIAERQERRAKLAAAATSSSSSSPTKASIETSSVKKSRGETKRSGTTKRSSSQSSASRPLEELCKSGFIRPLCWHLTNKRAEVQSVALKIVVCIAEVSEDDLAGIELWACLVEQGLVPLLESICLCSSRSTSHACVVGMTGSEVVDGTGREIDATTGGEGEGYNNNKASSRLRCKARVAVTNKLLQVLCHRLESSFALRTRLASALLHSGNPTLRINIFLGLFYAAGRSESLGKSLWALSVQQQQQLPKGMAIAPPEGPTGEVFRLMLSGLVREPSELRPIVLVVNQVLHEALKLKEPSASPTQKYNKKTPLLLSDGPTVLVLNEGQLVKMRCPDLKLIDHHSPFLANLLLTPHNDAVEDEAQKTDPVSLPQEQPPMVLAGSYATWQEIFSHMADDFLLESSVEKMPSDAVVEAFCIAQTFDMPILANRYAAVLSKRLTGDTLISTLECALGGHGVKDGAASFSTPLLPKPAPTNSANASALLPSFNTFTSSQSPRACLHLPLLSNCLSYLEKNIESVLNKRRPLRVTELNALVLECLFKLFLS